MAFETKIGQAIRASLLAGMMLAAPGVAGTGIAKSSASLVVSGTVMGEHGATTQPSGAVNGTLDPDTRVLTYSVSYSGLSGPVVAAHLHGPAAAGKEAGVLVPIKAPYASPISGTATLTPAQVKALRAGEIYVNLHTAAHPDGEARAQLAASSVSG